MKPTTIIVSDLHLGGGEADPGDDHVYQNGELAQFISELLDDPRGAHGGIELYFNGDFLEFAQTLQDAYQSPTSDAWCTQSQSLRKLEAILEGHHPVFDAIGALIDAGNAVTIAAGNHDVDLSWTSVQERLRKATRPALRFEPNEEWVERYDHALQISHGHIKDPANTFTNWKEPFVDVDERRLEMCPGTLFMTKFVNQLERRFPFADNIHPVQRLARILAKEKKGGFVAVTWAFLKILTRHPIVMSRGDADTYGKVLKAKVAQNIRVAEGFLKVAQAAGSSRYGDVVELRTELATDDALACFIIEFWPQIEGSDLLEDLDSGDGVSLGGGSDKTLGRIAKASDFGKESLRLVARNRAGNVDEARFIVMGHTHVPDDYLATHKMRYFNPGSWTRYVDLDQYPTLGLSDLQTEEHFPYSLKYVRIDQGDNGRLTGELLTFREQKAKFG